MHRLGNPIKHFWMVKDMARLAGVDLVEARHEGRLGLQEWADVVTRCRGCQWAEGCSHWMEVKDADELQEVPAACVNRTVFDRLRA